MATSSSVDVPLLISSENASSERRVSPSWTISQLKGRLEPITGVPASCQRLILKVGSQTPQAIEALDEDATELAAWPLQSYAEILVGRNHFMSVATFFMREYNSICLIQKNFLTTLGSLLCKSRGFINGSCRQQRERCASQLQEA